MWTSRCRSIGSGPQGGVPDDVGIIIARYHGEGFARCCRRGGCNEAGSAAVSGRAGGCAEDFGEQDGVSIDVEGETDWLDNVKTYGSRGRDLKPLASESRSFWADVGYIGIVSAHVLGPCLDHKPCSGSTPVRCRSSHIVTAITRAGRVATSRTRAHTRSHGSATVGALHTALVFGGRSRRIRLFHKKDPFPEPPAGSAIPRTNNNDLQ